jgi:hypothetical protein
VGGLKSEFISEKRLSFGRLSDMHAMFVFLWDRGVAEMVNSQGVDLIRTGI